MSEPTKDPSADAPVGAPADAGAPGADEAAASSSPDRVEGDDAGRGWPKSWIIVTAVLGVIAIIVVARLVGRSVATDAGPAGGPPPMHPGEPKGMPGEPKGMPGEPKGMPGEPKGMPGEPKGGMPGGGAPTFGAGEETVFDAKDVQYAEEGAACVAKDGKAYAFTKTATAPAQCKHSVRGRYVRLEVRRANPATEQPVMIYPTLPDAPPLLQMTLLPMPSDVPMWVATNMSPEIIVVFHGVGKAGIKLTSLRLFVGR